MKSKKLLTEKEKEYIKNQKEREKYQKNVQRQYDYRIREKARHMIDDLTLLAIHLPDQEQVQIFSEERLVRLVESILNPNRPDIAKVKNKMAKKEKRKIFYVSNERVFKLCNRLIDTAAQAGFGLIPGDVGTLISAQDTCERQLETVRRLKTVAYG